MDRIDKKLNKLGFKLTVNKDSLIIYEKMKKTYIHCIDIEYKSDGNHLISSYCADSNSRERYHYCTIDIPYKVIILIYKKLKKYIPRYKKHLKGS